MKHHLLTCLAILATIGDTIYCSFDSIKRDDNVLVLTKDNFDEATTDTTILVEFCKLDLNKQFKNINIKKNLSIYLIMSIIID